MNNQWRDNANLMVVWADGTYDSKRSCDECGLDNCHNVIHKDMYKEIGTTVLETQEAEVNALSYWDYMHSNQPLGGKFDFDGELVVKEYFTANPDGLAEPVARNSGITAEQHALAQEAYEQLSPKQQEIWDLVMRQQLSLTDAATQMDIKKQTAEVHLNRAKASVTAYLRSKTEC